MIKILPALLGNFKNPSKQDIISVTDIHNAIAMRIGYDGTIYSAGGGAALDVSKITFSDGSVQTTAAPSTDAGTF